MSGRHTHHHHDHHDHHDHPGGRAADVGSVADVTGRGGERRVLIAVALNVVVVVVQVVVGLAVSSIALLSDAAHNLTDVVALVLSFGAIRLTRRAPTPQLSFGWHRSTTLAAWINGTLVLGAAGWIVVESVGRLADPPAVRAWPVVVVALVGFVVNLGAARAVHLPDRGHAVDLNLRSAWLHLVSDAAASLVVAGSGIVVLLSGTWTWLDPAAAIVVALVVAWHAGSLLWATGAVLLEATPDDIELAELRQVVAAVPGVLDVHDVHVWALSHDARALSAHLVVDATSLGAAQEVGGRVKVVLAEQLRIGHATLELEARSCVDGTERCAFDG